MFLTTKVDPANDLTEYLAIVQHQKSWQDLLLVWKAQGELIQFCQDILVRLNIHYPCTVTTNEIFIKEMPGQNLLPVDIAALPDEALCRDASDEC